MGRAAVRDHVASLQKGLQVLTCFNRRHGRLTQSEVARLIGNAVGSRLPLYCSAQGRALLACMPPEEAELRVRRMARPALPSRTVCAADAVLALVARGREDGFSSCDGEMELGVRSMAVPVTDRAGTPVAAIGIAVRAEHMEMRELRSVMLPPLRQACMTLPAQIYPEE